MTPVRYVGWRDDLKGTTALARPAMTRGRKGEERVLIQLDQRHDDEETGGGENPLAFGWHDFAADQWEEIKEEG
jgi:hypothetical protein